MEKSNLLMGTIPKPVRKAASRVAARKVNQQRHLLTALHRYARFGRTRRFKELVQCVMQQASDPAHQCRIIQRVLTAKPEDVRSLRDIELILRVNFIIVPHHTPETQERVWYYSSTYSDYPRRVLKRK